MLEELVSVNDALPFDPAQLTRFHSRSPPGISIKDYLIRIVRFCSLEKSILLTVIYYIDFLCRTFSTFNINSLTVHRFLITTCMVGSKGLCDSFRTNGHYARVGGISKAELNLLEVEFLVRVDYRIVPRVEVLSRYYERMVMRMNNVYQLVEGISSSTPAGTTPSDTPTATTQLPSIVATTESRRGVGNVKRGSIDEGDSERVKRSLEGKEP
ncbi:Nuc-1 negative regulatory protein preg [Yarrowia sp. C11]|nr:Nuc-1 negative regulatory protein preg [Yarrowia sp. E02]KAG5367505.1 Nuc-1 negative regulatory protein preg [Yarrowia sp. C11]